MKKTAALLIALVLILPACSTFQKPPAGPTRVAPHPFDVPWEDRAVYRAGLIEAEQPALDRLADATVYHMDLIISDDMAVVKGSEKVRYSNQETVPLREI